MSIEIDFLKIKVHIEGDRNQSPFFCFYDFKMVSLTDMLEEVRFRAGITQYYPLEVSYQG